MSEIGPCAFFCVGHLLGENGLKFRFGHARPLAGARVLQLGRRRHHRDRVATGLRPGLEQQRNIEHRDRSAAALGVGQEALEMFGHSHKFERHDVMIDAFGALAGALLGELLR